MEHDQIIENQKIIARALVFLIEKEWKLNQSPAQKEMFEDMRKLAETHEFSKKKPFWLSQRD